MFVVQKDEKGKKTMITGISGFGFLGSKNGRFVTVNCFCFFGLLNPRWYGVLGGVRFLGQVARKGFDNKIDTENVDW